MCASYHTLRFGTIEYEEADAIRLESGVAPYGWATRFVLVSNEDEEPFSWLQSLDDPALCFVVAPLGELFREHCARVRSSLRQRNGGSVGPSATLLGIVVLAPDPSEMTINLLAPIVMYPESMSAEHLLLDAPPELARQPLQPALSAE